MVIVPSQMKKNDILNEPDFKRIQESEEIAINLKVKGGIILIDFSKRIDRFSLTKKMAKQLAHKLIKLSL